MSDIHPAADRLLGRLDAGETWLAVREVVDLYLEGVTCTEIVTEVLAPVQREVGVRWQTGRWTIVDEHRATAVIDDALGALSARLPPVTHERSVVLCSAEQEWHVTPLRMGALILRDQGWRVHLLGGSTPPAHLASSLRYLDAQVGVVHCAVTSNLVGVPPIVEVAHAAGIPVAAAGAAFGVDDHRALRLGCDGWAWDPQEGARLLEAWLDAPPPPPDPPRSPYADELERFPVLRPRLIADAFSLLEQRLPIMATYSRFQREHTQRDLGHSLDALEATMLVDDPRLLDGFLDWLQDLLVARDVPVAALVAGLDVLAEVAGDELPGARDLLAAEAAARRGSS